MLSASGFQPQVWTPFFMLVFLNFLNPLIPTGLRAARLGLRGRAFEKFVRDYRSLFAADPLTRKVLARELLRGTQLNIPLHKALLRF